MEINGFYYRNICREGTRLFDAELRPKSKIISMAISDISSKLLLNISTRKALVL